MRCFQAEELPGFTDALLDILQTEQEAPVKLSSMQLANFTPLSADMILTHDCSGCLPQEPRHKRLVPQRGLPPEQTNS